MTEKKQRYSFRMIRGLDAAGRPQLNDLPRLKADYRRLKQVRVNGESLGFKYVFGCTGQARLLVNMHNNKKTTANKAASFGKDAFGASCEVSAWDAVRPGEKFAPAATKTLKSATSTIEQEAKSVFGDSQGQAFLLGPKDGEVTTYSYSPEAGLVVSAHEYQPLEQAVEPAASDKSIDVGGDDSNQVSERLLSPRCDWQREQEQQQRHHEQQQQQQHQQQQHQCAITHFVSNHIVPHVQRFSQVSTEGRTLSVVRSSHGGEPISSPIPPSQDTPCPSAGDVAPGLFAGPQGVGASGTGLGATAETSRGGAHCGTTQKSTGWLDNFKNNMAYTTEMVAHKVHTLATHAAEGVLRRNDRGMHTTMQAFEGEHERGRSIFGRYGHGTGTRCGQGDDVVSAGGESRAHSRSASTVDAHQPAQGYCENTQPASPLDVSRSGLQDRSDSQVLTAATPQAGESLEAVLRKIALEDDLPSSANSRGIPPTTQHASLEGLIGELSACGDTIDCEEEVLVCDKAGPNGSSAEVRCVGRNPLKRPRVNWESVVKVLQTFQEVTENLHPVTAEPAAQRPRFTCNSGRETPSQASGLPCPDTLYIGGDELADEALCECRVNLESDPEDSLKQLTELFRVSSKGSIINSFKATEDALSPDWNDEDEDGGIPTLTDEALCEFRVNLESDPENSLKQLAEMLSRVSSKGSIINSFKAAEDAISLDWNAEDEDGGIPTVTDEALCEFRVNLESDPENSVKQLAEMLFRVSSKGSSINSFKAKEDALSPDWNAEDEDGGIPRYPAQGDSLQGFQAPFRHAKTEGENNEHMRRLSENSPFLESFVPGSLGGMGIRGTRRARKELMDVEGDEGPSASTAR